MKSVPDENRDRDLPGTDIDDALADAMANVLAGNVPPSGADVGFPDWLPENIWDMAHFFLRHAGEEAYGSHSSSVLATVERLIYEPQMKAVWTQLLQKSRTTGEFRLAANLKTMFGRGRADEIHHASTIIVFRDAVTFGLESFKFAEKRGAHYLEQAQKLRSDARSLERMLTERRLKSLSPREVHRIAKKFDDAANAYQLLADLVGSAQRPTDLDSSDLDLFDPEFGASNDMVSNEITSPSQRLFEKRTLAKRFALKMAATMRALFGDAATTDSNAGVKAMYGTVATITRVALDDNEITGHMVREWCAQEPASPDSRDNEKLIELLTAWRHGLEIKRGNNSYSNLYGLADID